MKYLIVITGPTAAGKTELSVRLAIQLGCDIISADSRQFYQGMPIGTAAPDDKEIKKVRHHFVGFLPVNSYYSASMFEKDAINLLGSLYKEKEVVIMTGGSGLYINAVCEGIDDIPDVDPGIRERYISKLREEGIESLRTELRIVDPHHYARVDLRNPRRIMRALEIFASTGRPYSSFLNKNRTERNFRVIKIGIMPEREELYSRIDRRVDRMMASGLEEEAKGLLEFRNENALQTVGYRELFDWFDGKISKEEAVSLIKRNTRRYARRQITWWSRDKQIRWFLPEKTTEILDHISKETGISF
ncbi:MAG: tRNA (adenosine(37)-N6)-dimethylallyltransferase MiaA [Bacteroidales bacterium]